MRTRILAFLLLVFVASASFAQKIPNIELGFNANRVYQTGDVDHVNLFNGNLIVTLPIGQSYHVNGNLSYGMKLVYNSNVWDYRIVPQYDPGHTNTESVPNLRSNAGMGWRLTMARLIAPYDGTSTNRYNYPGVEAGWSYEDESGAEHAFTPYAYGVTYVSGTSPSLESFAVQFTTDGSNVRMVRTSATERKLQFPDGSEKTFRKAGNAWRLERVSDGWGNYVSLVYTSAGSGPNQTLKITISDNSLAGRVQTIDFTYDAGFADGVDGGMKVSQVTLAAFGAATATYLFAYTTTSVPMGCNADIPPNSPTSRSVSLLTGVTLPDLSTYSFDYHTTGFGCEQGALKTLTLPTGGTIGYTYQMALLPNSLDACHSDRATSQITAIRSRTVGSDRWDYVQTTAAEAQVTYDNTATGPCFWSDGGGEPGYSHTNPIVRWSRTSVLAPPRPGLTTRSRSDYYFNTYNKPGEIHPTFAHDADTLTYGWPLTAGVAPPASAASTPGGQMAVEDVPAVDPVTSSPSRFLSEVQYDNCTA